MPGGLYSDRFATFLRAKQGRLITNNLIGSGLNVETTGIYTRRILDGNTLHYALAWYRALRFKNRTFAIHQIKVPTLFIYGGKDSYLSEKAAQLTRQWVTGEYTFAYLPSATHWIPEEQPKLLTETLIAFILQSVSKSNNDSTLHSK